MIYALDKFGELRNEFLDPNTLTRDKFGDRVFLYELMLAFLYYLAHRYDLKDTFKAQDFIVVTFNQFVDFVDANDSYMEDLGILDLMNTFVYRVMHLVVAAYGGCETIDNEEMLKNLVNIALNQETYKV